MKRSLIHKIFNSRYTQIKKNNGYIADAMGTRDNAPTILQVNSGTPGTRYL
jgi:hypothetical protein